ncbi:uncharacterized protein LOC110725314 isoform X2 [Chenopodium quinoa]|uniref:uncharacterized protein LOC110725314 isoform X2 n=1 Tax=Chenopodium quinoa TaxID=63459 RepID=UPI000B772A1F|nr:uncharacterized protein LOC110725314 isoform X2 [Chenopodium quinoa]
MRNHLLLGRGLGRLELSPLNQPHHHAAMTAVLTSWPTLITSEMWGPNRFNMIIALQFFQIYPISPRRRWFARLKALKFSFGRLFGREKKKAWKYENVESRDRENRYRTSPSPRRGRGRCSKFSKKLGYVLKQFSCGSKCSKGGFDRNDDQYQDLRNNS